MIWYVAAGSGLGGMARYLLTAFIQQRTGPAFPWGTLVINITGALLLGFLARYAAGTQASPGMRLFLTTGLCGGYTTFSTFSFEAAGLMQDGEYRRALVYIGLSVVLGLAAMFAGFALAHQALAIRAEP